MLFDMLHKTRLHILKLCCKGLKKRIEQNVYTLKRILKFQI